MPNVVQQPQSNEPKLSVRPATETHEARQNKMKELLAKVQLMHDAQLSGGKLEGQNPHKVYCWVNSRDDRQAFFQAWGWVLCVDPNVKSMFRKEDLTHRRADVVLYEIDRDLYEAQEAFKQLRGLEGIEGHKNAAVAAFNRMGVKEYIPNA